MVLLLAASLLASTPTTPVVRTTLRAQVDVGGMLGSSWYVTTLRGHLENALTQAKGLLLDGRDFDALSLAYAAPMVGPLLAARQSDDPFESALLVTSGVLQTVGLGLGAAQLFGDTEHGVVERGPVVSFSPIAAGRLGLSVRITGF